MRTNTTIAAVNAALATGTLAALAAAVKATGASHTGQTDRYGHPVPVDAKCGKSMRAALTHWLEGEQTATPAVPAPVIRMNTDTAPATVPQPEQGKVDRPVQGATGQAKCYVHTADGKLYTPANGVQALAHAFATVTTSAELEALVDMVEQLALDTAKRLESKPATPKADKPAAPKAAAQNVKPAADAVAPKATKKASKPKADALAAYRKLQAECKALGVSAKGTKDELTARIAAAKAKPAPKADSQTIKPAADAGFTPKTLNRLEALADALGVRLADLVAAAELTGVKLS